MSRQHGGISGLTNPSERIYGFFHSLKIVFSIGSDLWGKPPHCQPAAEEPQTDIEAE